MAYNPTLLKPIGDPYVSPSTPLSVFYPILIQRNAEKLSVGHTCY